MRRLILLVMAFYSATILAQEEQQTTNAQESSSKQSQHFTIEKLNLEAQTIQLKGKTYVLAKNIVIIDSNNVPLGLKGLKLGQTIEFHLVEDKNAASFREDLTLLKIGQIKIISSSNKPDELH